MLDDDAVRKNQEFATADEQAVDVRAAVLLDETLFRRGTVDARSCL
jgi:hypothetical protein